MCATIWIAGTETLVGCGAIDLRARTPDLILADEAGAPGLGALLIDALVACTTGRRAA